MIKGSRLFTKSLIGIVLVGALVFSVWAGYTSIRYERPFPEVVKTSVRYFVLSSIAVGVSIYDPSCNTVVKAITGPLDSESTSAVNCRIEDYVAVSKGKMDIRSVQIHNEKIMTSPFHFSYQPDSKRLRIIRDKMGLDKVVSGSVDELDRMVRLRDWVRRQFGRKDFQKTMVQFDALAIWENPQRNPEMRAKTSDEYNPCHFFPLFYSQVMLSMGYTIRLVAINKDEYGTPHGFTEVWSNQYGKWISMDPDLNLHYVDHNVPLNLIEVHNTRYASNPGLKVVQIMVEPGVQPIETPEDMIAYHRYIRIGDLRNDWLTNVYFKGHPMRSDRSTLFFEDKREKEVWRLIPVTDKPDEMYWTLNQAEIHVQAEQSEKGKLSLVFKTVTPNFSYYKIDDKGDVSPLKSSRFVWSLKKGDNRLMVTPVNSFGVEGIPSRVELIYDA